jgi:hypothetical protein
MDDVLERLKLIRTLRSTDSLPFTFVAKENTWPEGFIARVPNTVADKDELMAILARELRFPDYFGENWDALRDCLRDLSWLPDYRIIINHEGIPRQVANDDLAIYLEILLVTVREWRLEETSEHDLVVVFPETDREAIERLLIEDQ